MMRRYQAVELQSAEICDTSAGPAGRANRTRRPVRAANSRWATGTKDWDSLALTTEDKSLTQTPLSAQEFRRRGAQELLIVLECINDPRHAVDRVEC